MTHYIHDEKNNRIVGMSKEEIYALLAAAIQQGQLPSVDADTAFVTMIKSIVDANNYKMGVCTQAQYNQLAAQGALQPNTLYIITDDTSYDDIIDYIEDINADIETLQTSVTELETFKTNLIKTDTVGATATATGDTTFTIQQVFHNEIYKIGNIAFIDYWVMILCTGNGTTNGDIDLTVPADFIPSHLVELNSNVGTTFNISNLSVQITQRLNPNGTIKLRCTGNMGTGGTNGTFVARVYGQYLIL